MNEFIVINGHAPWCSMIRTLHRLDGEEPCDCQGWDDDDPCRCLAWDPVENDHTKAEHEDCDGSLHGGATPCGGCDSCVSAMSQEPGRQTVPTRTAAMGGEAAPINPAGDLPSVPAPTADTAVWISTPRAGISYHYVDGTGRYTVCGRYIGTHAYAPRGHVLPLAEVVERFGSTPCATCDGGSKVAPKIGRPAWT